MRLIVVLKIRLLSFQYEYLEKKQKYGKITYIGKIQLLE